MAKSTGASSLSASVRVRYGSGLFGACTRTSKTVKLNKSAKRLAEEAKGCRDQIAHALLHSFPLLTIFNAIRQSELSFEDRQLILDANAALNDIGGSSSNEYTEDSGFNTIPPGEEGMFLSHAGGAEEIIQDLLSQFRTDQYAIPPSIPSPTHQFCRKRADLRTRKDRVQVRTDAWQQQIPRLIKAYLAWNHSGPPDSTATAVNEQGGWEITVVDFFRKSLNYSACSPLTGNVLERGVKHFQHTPSAHFVNEELALHGYLGASPDAPTVAISFQVLLAYRQLHRVCPRLSAQALVKALCHLHRVRFRLSLRVPILIPTRFHTTLISLNNSGSLTMSSSPSNMVWIPKFGLLSSVKTRFGTANMCARPAFTSFRMNHRSNFHFLRQWMETRHSN